jgi:hypothetical protein
MGSVTKEIVSLAGHVAPELKIEAGVERANAGAMDTRENIAKKQSINNERELRCVMKKVEL